MYKKNRAAKSSIVINQAVEGETIEMKIERVVNNKEPITDGAPLIYTERGSGVQAGYNIRTDRFDVAVEAMDKVTKVTNAKREERRADKVKKTPEETKNGGEPTSTQGTEN